MSYLSDEKYVDWIALIFTEAKVQNIFMKTQFGGNAIFSGEYMFGILLRNQTYIKLSRENAKVFLGQDHDGVIDMIGYPKVNGYYHLDEKILTSSSILSKLAAISIALTSKIRDAERLTNSLRIKDQANMNYSYEKQCFRVGIDSIQKLREIGAKEAYIRLSKINKKPQFITLLKLEGAIQGKHMAVLETETIQEYREWWNNIFKKIHDGSD